MNINLYYLVQNALSRLENLYQSEMPSKELTFRLISELKTALYELQMTSVELLEQNEEMALNRLKLEEERGRYQELFDFAPDGYLVTDTEGIILEANIAATNLFNTSKLLLIGMPLANFVATEERSFFRTKLAQMKKETGIQNGDWEFAMLSSKQTAFPVSLTVGKVITFRGETAELRWLLRDITMRRQMEEEVQKAAKLESLGVLAGGITHDLNNFLTIILGNLSLAKMHTNKDQKVYEYFEEMEEGLTRTGYLTGQLVTFAKGGKPLTKAVSIRKLIEEVSTLVLSGSKTSHELFLAKELPLVEIDQGQITQVITNLLINADQAMPEGGKVKITAQSIIVANENNTMQLQTGSYLALSIIDEGIGISNQILPKIFDPYFTTKEEGSGLGLTICYSIVKKHGGHISVQSEDGKGTSFTVYLPISSVQTTNDAPKENLIFGRGRILLMDDQELVRQTAKEMLTCLGYDVELAADGDEALAIYKEAFLSDYPFEVVITDLTVHGGMGEIGRASCRERV